VFLPALWLASIYSPGSDCCPRIGLVWIRGGIVLHAVLHAGPSKRGLGFGISA